MTESRFRIVIASLPDYERVVAEIYHGDRFVCLVSQEQGPGQFDVETPGPGQEESAIARRVNAAGLQSAVSEAQRRLLEGPRGSRE